MKDSEKYSIAHVPCSRLWKVCSEVHVILIAKRVRLAEAVELVGMISVEFRALVIDVGFSL